MRFSNATTAIEWWWEQLLSGGVSLVNQSRMQEEYDYFEQIQTSRRRWIPHDALCTYLDIGKTLDKLSKKDRSIVKDYLLKVVGIHDQEQKRTPYFSWAYQGYWPHVKKRFWNLLPQEYKYGSRKQRKQTPHTKRNSVVSKSRSYHGDEDVEVRQTQRLQSWQPLACTC
jgi:hypothetical protein